ncbi:MAG: hypothetical protein ABR541_03660 [Candidatus Dormibacteria bacterium]
MTDPQRDPGVVMRESAGLLALVATRRLYEEQPTLWDLGESGRARTLEDFGHHFNSLSLLDAEAFDAHVRYCVRLFTARGFPLRWLDDAWRVMTLVMPAHLPSPVANMASSIVSKHAARAG